MENNQTSTNKDQNTYVNISKLEQLQQELTPPSSIKLTETETKLLTDLNTKKESVRQEVSYLAQQRLNLNYRQEQAEKLYRNNLEFERELGTQLTEKYGNGTIDIEKGIFIPA